MAGQIQTFVFDKTGTLTEEGLSVLGMRPTGTTKLNIGNDKTKEQTIFTTFEQEAKNLSVVPGPWWLGDNAASNRSLNTTLFLEGMASCTAITYVNGQLVGDPLDVKMFEATGWTLDETDQRANDADDND